MLFLTPSDGDIVNGMSFHGGTCPFLLCDGAVTELSESIDPIVYLKPGVRDAAFVREFQSDPTAFPVYFCVSSWPPLPRSVAIQHKMAGLRA